LWFFMAVLRARRPCGFRWEIDVPLCVDCIILSSAGNIIG
jgi:hypothetical protein